LRGRRALLPLEVAKAKINRYICHSRDVRGTVHTQAALFAARRSSITATPGGFRRRDTGSPETFLLDLAGGASRVRSVEYKKVMASLCREHGYIVGIVERSWSCENY
jgi:hypothetical protein